MNITGLRKTFLFSFFQKLGQASKNCQTASTCPGEKHEETIPAVSAFMQLLRIGPASLFLAGEIYHESSVPLLIAAFCKFFLHLD